MRGHNVADAGLGKRLLLLAAAAILPIAAASAVAIHALVQQQQLQTERAAIELARALATAVDGELRRSISVLEALATSLRLDRGELKDYYQEAQRVVASRPLWLALNLADPSGNVLFNTRVPFDRTPPGITERESFERAVESLKPAVGNLSKGGISGEIGFTVRAPVIRNGQLRYVLTAIVKPDAIVEIINRQHVPGDWVISVFDARGMRVARSRAHNQYLGTPAAPSLQKLMEIDAREGSGVTYALEGDQIVSAFSRLDQYGWTVAPGIPLTTVNAGVFRSLAVYGGGIALSILLGGLVVLFIARGSNKG
jgi:hypothetical protein